MNLAAGEAKSPELSVAVCQLTSVDDLRRNRGHILELLSRLESDPPDLICFPENALYFRIREGADVSGIEADDENIRAVSEWASRHRSVVHLGSAPLKKNGRLFNSSLVLTPDGAVHDNYQKIHLFDVDVDGVRAQRESDVFTHGAEPAVFEVNGWKIGSSICYDLRFSELYLHYARIGADVILIPSAFLVPTGQAHWEVLIRARAIECQAYVLAAAQGESHLGVQGGRRSTYGHSMIVDPWGEVVSSIPGGFNDEQRVLRAVLKQERINSVRTQIPMKNHRRLGLSGE